MSTESRVAREVRKSVPGSILHSFALLPEEPLARVFATQRARYDPVHASMTVPHVTMKLACVLGEGPPATHEDLITWLIRECRDQRPFEVQLGDVGIFESCSGYGYVLYVAVRPTPPLVELHDRLVHALARAGAKTAGLSIEQEVSMFFPHLTLAQGLSVAGAQESLALAWEEHVVSTFLADRLVTAHSVDGRRWQVVGNVWFCGS